MDSHGKPLWNVKNDFGSVYFGDIRQVLFRAESIGFLIQQLREAQPYRFGERLRRATKKIADSWLLDIHRTNAFDTITPEQWAYYDSWAGFGRISCLRKEPDAYMVEIQDPFTQSWNQPEEIHKMFWEGYVSGIIEGIIGVPIVTSSVEGNMNDWVIKIKLQRKPE